MKHPIWFVLLIAIAVVLIWRGVWGILDGYFFPNNYELSSWISILIGLVILLFTYYARKELI